MSYADANEARNTINDLVDELRREHNRDPDQVIYFSQFGTIDAAVRDAREHLGDDPVVREIRELISPEAVAENRELPVGEMLPSLSILSGKLNRLVTEMALNAPGAVRRRTAGPE